MKLKLSEWANVAEIVGAAAVIISLVYVGYQVNDNTSAIRSAALNDTSVAVQAWYQEIGSNRQASDLWFNAMTSPEPLSTHDEFQFLMMHHAVMLVKDLPGMGRYWRQRRGFLHRGFAEYVDGLLERDSVETLDMYKTAEPGRDQ